MLFSGSILSLQEFGILAINLLVRISAESLKLESGVRLPAARSRLEGRRIWNQGQESSSGVKEPEARSGTQRIYKKPLHFKPSPCKQTKAQCSLAGDIGQ